MNRVVSKRGFLLDFSQSNFFTYQFVSYCVQFNERKKQTIISPDIKNTLFDCTNLISKSIFDS